MLFSSIPFLFAFLPVVLLVSWLLHRSIGVQNLFLFAASLYFYWLGAGKYWLLLVASIGAATVWGLLIRSYPQYKKVFLWASCLQNLLILIYYKLAASQMLPLGISFYTFQAISYVVDVYRKEVRAEKNPFTVGLYLVFFPQLIAGPIVRYHSIAEQIHNRHMSIRRFSVGCCRFTVGLAKKTLLANVFAPVADLMFQSSAADTLLTVAGAWIGALAFALQIYYDFSAYSDMAIGLALLFGFKLEENFRYPYQSESMVEFWRRWHISLSAWFREYVYIPLGGSRVRTQDQLVRNLFVVWLLTGLWHGMAWTFVFWGLYQLFFVVCEKLVCFDQLRLPGLIKHLYVILVLLFGWVLFRADSIVLAERYMADMLGLHQNALWSARDGMVLREYGWLLLAGVLFSLPVSRMVNQWLMEGRLRAAEKLWNGCYPVVLILLFLVCTAYLVSGSYQPFLYFAF